MKSIVARSQKVHIIERTKPMIKPSYLLIKTLHSVISPGTELSLIGISEEREITLGYSAVGVVMECGEGVDDYQKGDIVACYGAPYVGHSDCLLVPTTLCAKVPSGVEPEEAALAGIGAIAIHALRIAKLEFGETVVIVGLGLLGQMIAKIANAAAYNVVAFDIQAERAAMLHEETSIRSFSTIPEMESEIENCTRKYGADAVLLCAGGKRSSLTNQSLEWVRQQGKVVIVGDIEPDFPRNLLFAKEAQILISRAGGPGRYDEAYEKQAIDYPYGYVRWTEGRNVAEYLRLVKDKRINVQPFLTDQVGFKDAPAAYEELINKKSMSLTKIINYIV
ncbi:zinc-binding dehydrogenase [Sporosarcina sp. ANT_H38]|uniref:zinc-binding dehydrogenase n=1 Tax=Sporosarcina sp. ANT_H38 TaxID=2597358 RepID=UPI0011F14574|nr:zinc-binding alcohol dehydrogenase [Sporosarcina sp. ANT_H38]KAA0965486.1 zinc-binding dehydrogenase [Sporosarcina sp. ANT_H38]